MKSEPRCNRCGTILLPVNETDKIPPIPAPTLMGLPIIYKERLYCDKCTPPKEIICGSWEDYFDA